MDNEDILLWPCGTWCYAIDLQDYGFMSDDFERIAFGTDRYFAIELT